ncbi:hypothetical protein [Amycolatopsis sp.]|uniref:hypothetical protein n=1 Tax=Amycolatopsis sp. TaxID=37632 RepID=UPI00263925F3|nr:hypothetical protein [Amycolatopsis sp.]
MTSSDGFAGDVVGWFAAADLDRAGWSLARIAAKLDTRQRGGYSRPGSLCEIRKACFARLAMPKTSSNSVSVCASLRRRQMASIRQVEFLPGSVLLKSSGGDLQEPVEVGPKHHDVCGVEDPDAVVDAPIPSHVAVKQAIYHRQLPSPSQLVQPWFPRLVSWCRQGRPLRAWM